MRNTWKYVIYVEEKDFVNLLDVKSVHPQTHQENLLQPKLFNSITFYSYKINSNEIRSCIYVLFFFLDILQPGRFYFIQYAFPWNFHRSIKLDEKIYSIPESKTRVSFFIWIVVTRVLSCPIRNGYSVISLSLNQLKIVIRNCRNVKISEKYI